MKSISTIWLRRLFRKWKVMFPIDTRTQRHLMGSKCKNLVQISFTSRNVFIGCNVSKNGCAVHTLISNFGESASYRCFLRVWHCLSHDNKDVTAFIPWILACDVPGFAVPKTVCEAHEMGVLVVLHAPCKPFCMQWISWSEWRQPRSTKSWHWSRASLENCIYFIKFSVNVTYAINENNIVEFILARGSVQRNHQEAWLRCFCCCRMERRMNDTGSRKEEQNK